MSDTRFILCTYCGSEGRIYQRDHWEGGFERDCGVCPVCEGTGLMEQKVEPIEMEDLPCEMEYLP